MVDLLYLASKPINPPDWGDRPPLAVLRLSQGALNLLDSCPRRFQHSYLSQISSFPNPDQQASLTLGSQFHLLMQQRELGLPILALAEMNTKLKTCVQSIVDQAPDLFTIANPSDQTIRESEHSRTLLFRQANQDYLLTVIYDLLILEPEKAQILDWKTYARPERREWLAQNWQTRLYLYVLAETSPYQQEQLSMTYWFVQPSEQAAINPQFHRFTYSDTQHQQTRSDLAMLLNQLTVWLQGFQAGQDLPQVPESKGICLHCPFVVKCQRHQPDSPAMPSIPNDWWIELAEIQEITV